MPGDDSPSTQDLHLQHVLNQTARWRYYNLYGSYVASSVGGGGTSLHLLQCSLNQTTATHALILKVLVATIDAQWEGRGDVGSVRCEPPLLPPCPTIRVLCCSS